MQCDPRAVSVSQTVHIYLTPSQGVIQGRGREGYPPTQDVWRVGMVSPFTYTKSSNAR